MNLPNDAAFIRQAATMAEMEEDEKNGRFISSLWRTRKWEKHQSDRFFQRVKVMLWKRHITLDKVWLEMCMREN